MITRRKNRRGRLANDRSRTYFAHWGSRAMTSVHSALFGQNRTARHKGGSSNQLGGTSCVTARSAARSRDCTARARITGSRPHFSIASRSRKPQEPPQRNSGSAREYLVLTYRRIVAQSSRRSSSGSGPAHRTSAAEVVDRTARAARRGFATSTRPRPRTKVASNQGRLGLGGAVIGHSSSHRGAIPPDYENGIGRPP
jgi:hypothetical protein